MGCGDPAAVVWSGEPNKHSEGRQRVVTSLSPPTSSLSASEENRDVGSRGELMVGCGVVVESSL